MNEVIAYEVIEPVLVEETSKCIMAVPEGGTLGFDGEFIYVKNFAGVWKKMLTERKFLLQWIENGWLKRKLLSKNQATEEIKKAYTPSKPQAIIPVEGVPPIEEGVLANPSLLPMVLPLIET